jgi:hypothetical protein
MRPRKQYRTIQCEAWQDGPLDMRSLGVEAQLLHMQLLTGLDVSACGVAPIKVRWWASLARGLTVASVTDALDELETHGFVYADHDTCEVWVRDYIDHDNGTASPNQQKSILMALRRVNSANLSEVIESQLESEGITWHELAVY